MLFHCTLTRASEALSPHSRRSLLIASAHVSLAFLSEFIHWCLGQTSWQSMCRLSWHDWTIFDRRLLEMAAPRSETSSFFISSAVDMWSYICFLHHITIASSPVHFFDGCEGLLSYGSSTHWHWAWHLSHRNCKWIHGFSERRFWMLGWVAIHRIYPMPFTHKCISNELGHLQSQPTQRFLLSLHWLHIEARIHAFFIRTNFIRTSRLRFAQKLRTS